MIKGFRWIPLLCCMGFMHCQKFATPQEACLQSELHAYKTGGIMDTIPPLLRIKVVLADSKEITVPSADVNVSVYEAGSQQRLATAFTDTEGSVGLYVPFSDPKQVFELRLSRSGFNSLWLKKMSLSSGIIKIIQVQLGKRGTKEKVQETVYEVSVEGRS
jgi:hypothetical protein